MSDTSTDDLPEAPTRDRPADLGRDAEVAVPVDAADVDDDGPAEPPVIACGRCEARVVLGSRYCPSCGTPLVRSGEQAATALSRTRRPAPAIVRVGVPSLLVAVVLAILWVTSSDPVGDERDALQSRLERVVGEHRTLSDRLEELEGETDPGAALGAARVTLATLRDVEDETEGVESGTTGRTTRVRRALATDRLYLTAVIGVLQDPGSPLLAQLGRRSARAVAALRSVDDIAVTKDAIRGTRILAEAVRARAAQPAAGASAPGRAATTRPPFVRAVERVLRSGAEVRPDVARGFALLRAARDGSSTWEGEGARPASADAAVQEARRLFAKAATARTASAGAARAIPANQANQRAITTKLAAAYEAAGATATKLEGCIGSFENSGGATVAPQCLESVRPLSATEADRTRAFVASYRPARTAAGLGATPAL